MLPIPRSLRKKFPRLAAVVLAAILVGPAPAQVNPLSTDSGFGVWPWLVGNVDASVPAIVQTAVQTGQDTIYLHLWRTTGTTTGVLHMVDEAGSWAPAWGAIDPDVTLRSFISQAHAAGLQVVGVVNCFLDGGPLPGQPSHEALLLSVIDYLANTRDGTGRPFYELDGIALDRVRFYSGTGNPHQLVTAFVQQVRNVVGPMPLHAFLPANLWHIDGPPYDGSFRTFSDAMFWLETQYGHRWEDLSALLDVSLPMAYVAEGGLYGNNTSLMEAYLNTVASHARQAQANGGVSTLRVLPCVRAWNDTSGTTTAASLDACIRGALLGGADGTMVFRYFTAAGQTSWWNAIGSHAAPGSDVPVAALSVSTAAGATVVLNASASTAPPAAVLEARFDEDGDGIADTAWSPNLVHTFLGVAGVSTDVGVEVRDGAGRRAYRAGRVTPQAAQLTVSGPYTSISAGSLHVVSLNAGAGAAGATYFLAGSVTGTSPGLTLAPGLVAPLVPDWFTDLTIMLAGGPYLPGFLGSLDSAGWVGTSFSIPPGALPPSLSGSRIWLAGAGFDSTWTPLFVSGSASILVFP